ncbi:hypothetical protein HDU85_006105 [Gaertneriomyces sp. JEL0708]|nr:hypothetical protein HDU85_006105 [Gaertneriomyces sp. JEL0708]
MRLSVRHPFASAKDSVKDEARDSVKHSAKEKHTINNDMEEQQGDDGKKQHGKRRGRLSNVLHFRRKHSKKVILSINTSTTTVTSTADNNTALAACAENNTTAAAAEPPHNNNNNNDALSPRREVWQEAIRRLSGDQQQHRSSSEGSKTLANSCHQLSPVSPAEYEDTATAWHDGYNKHSSLRSNSLSSSPSEDSVFPRRRFSGTSIYTTATHTTHYDPYPYPVYASVDAAKHDSYPSTLDSSTNVKISLWRNRPSALSIPTIINNDHHQDSMDPSTPPPPASSTTTSTQQYPLGLDLHRRSFSSSRRSLELDHPSNSNSKRLSASSPSSANSRAAKDKLDALMGSLGPFTDTDPPTPARVLHHHDTLAHPHDQRDTHTHRDSVKRLSQALDRVSSELRRVSLDLCDDDGDNHTQTSISQPSDTKPFDTNRTVRFPSYTGVVAQSGVDVEYYERLRGRFCTREERRAGDAFERVLEKIENQVVELGAEGVKSV